MRTIALFLFVCACASSVKMYDGPAKDGARIEPNDIIVHSLDGKKLDANTSLKKSTLEVLPGKHTIRVEWSMEPNYATRLPIGGAGAGAYRGTRRVGVMERYRKYFAEIEFEAKAGRTYRGVWVQGEDGREREPAIEEVTSKE